MAAGARRSADLLARKGHAVRLWAYEAEVVEAINLGSRESAVSARMPSRQRGCARTQIAAGDVWRERTVVLSVAPSHVVRSVLQRAAAAAFGHGTLVVSATKGFEPDSLAADVGGVVEQSCRASRVAALSGPSFALEVYQQQPTAVVAAARDQAHVPKQRAEGVRGAAFPGVLQPAT